VKAWKTKIIHSLSRV